MTAREMWLIFLYGFLDTLTFGLILPRREEFVRHFPGTGKKR